MMKKSLFVGIGMLALLLSGCGGGLKPGPDPTVKPEPTKEDTYTVEYDEERHWHHYSNGEDTDFQNHSLTVKEDEQGVLYVECSGCSYKSDIYRYEPVGNDAYQIVGVRREYDQGHQHTDEQPCRPLKKVTIPAKHNNKPVVKVGYNAFNQRGIEELEFENGSQIVEIGEYAFNQNYIKEVTIPETVQVIGARAFYTAIPMSEALYIPSSVNEIGSDAFNIFAPIYTLNTEIPTGWELSTSLSGPILPIYLEHSGPDLSTEDGFDYVINAGEETVTLANYHGEATDITIPSTVVINEVTYSVSKIGKYAFVFNQHIEHVTFPNTVVEIANHSIIDCFNLKTVFIPSSVEVIGETMILMLGYGNSMTPEQISQSVNVTFYLQDSSIKETWDRYFDNIVYGQTYRVFNVGSAPQNNEYFTYFFNSNQEVVILNINVGDNVTELVIPEKIEEKNVVEISADSLGNREHITKITLPATIRKIGDRAFGGMPELVEVDIPSENALATIGKNAFAFDYKLETITLSNSIRTIDEWAFAFCFELKAINLGNALTFLGGNAFTDCYSLTSINIPGTVKEISTDAFHQCLALTDITIGNGVEVLDYGCFRSCLFMDLYIPESVTEVGYGWDGLTDPLTESEIVDYKNSDYYSPKGLENITEEIYEECNNHRTYYFGSDSTYFAHYVTNYQNIYSVSKYNIVSGDFVFMVVANQVALQKYNGEGGDVVIPDKVTIDGISKDVERIATGVFKGNSTIDSVTLPANLKRIDSYAFYQSSISSVVLPDSLNYIGDYAFYDAVNLTKVIIPSKDIDMRYSPFGFLNPNEGHTDIIYPYGAPSNAYTYGGTTDYLYIFDAPFTVNHITYAQISETEVAVYGHEKEYAYGDIVIPASVEFGSKNFTVSKVFGNAFENALATSVTLPSSIKEIGDYAFYGITNKLASVDLSACDKLERIGAYAFYSNYDLATVLLPEGLLEIGNNAFGLASSLSEIIIPSTVTNIASYAFYNSHLTTVTILSENLTIEDYAFASNDGLTNLTMPESVIYSIHTFEDTQLTGLPVMFVGTIYEATNLSSSNKAKVGKMAIKVSTASNPTNTLEGKALIGFTNLTELTIEPGITCEKGCLYGLNKLTKLSMVFDQYLAYYFGKKNVSDYLDGYEPFANSYQLTQPISIIDGDNSRGTLQQGLYLPTSLTKLYVLGGSSNLDGSPFSFMNAVSLTEVKFSPSFNGTKIAFACFKGCTGIKSITLPDSIEILGMETFYGTGLTSFTAPEVLRTIRRNCFEGCTDLETVTFGTGFRWLWPLVFKGCTSLTSVTFQEVAKTWYLFNYEFDAQGNPTGGSVVSSNYNPYNPTALASDLVTNIGHSLAREDYAN